MKKLTSIIVFVASIMSASPVFALDRNPASDLFFSLPSNNPTAVIQYIIQILLGVAGVIALLLIIYGGYQYMFSGSNEELAEQGKKTLQHSIGGLIIIILSYIIVTVVINTLFKAV